MTRLRAFAAALVVVIAVAFAWRLGLFDVRAHAHAVATIARLRTLPAAKVVFVLAFGVATAVGVPASPFTLAGGALFGTWAGMALNWVGAMLGAVLGYVFAAALREPMLSWMPERRRTQLEMLGARHGGRTLFRLRVIPVVPFALLNVSAALVRMRWGVYLAATGLGIVPVIVVYTTFAASIVSGAQGAGGRALVLALASGSALVALSLVPRLVARRRGAASA